MNSSDPICPKCLIPLRDCPCEPDTTDIPEASPGWFERASLVLPERSSPANIYYLATPYMGFLVPDGTATRDKLQLAYEAAIFNACVLMRADVMVYCPVAHGHAIASALHGRLIDEQVWLAHGRLMMPYCRGMIRCRIPGWDQSSGVTAEARWFAEQGRPVVEMEPGVVPPGLVDRDGNVTF